MGYSFLETLTGGALQREDGAIIPLDLDNMDYQAFLAEIAAGAPAPEGWSGPKNE